jgi:adenosylmethionine-8-amino-7-oxononanoate aminotransferase
MLATVALTDEVLERQPDAIARVVAGAREAGVLVRAQPQSVAVSPPLTATTDHFEQTAQAIDVGIGALSASDLAR